MEKKCEICGTEYEEALEKCPLCNPEKIGEKPVNKMMLNKMLLKKR